MKRLRFPSHWLERKAAKEKISVLTCYDAPQALLAERAGIDAILVGDSLGMVVQGQSSTLPVTLEHMIYHAQCVRRGARETFVIVDLPFGSYQTSVTDGMKNSMRIMQETGAQAVKLEGADQESLHLVGKLVAAGVPVMGHVGLTPQSFLSLGGFRVQGRSEAEAVRIARDARMLAAAGCFAVVLEMVPVSVAEAISAELQIPTIGIGAGPGCDGQVQVFMDLVGMNPDFSPRHARKFDQTAERWISAIGSYDREVKSGTFPGPEQSHGQPSA